MVLMMILFIPLLLLGMPIAFAMGIAGSVGVLNVGVNELVIPQKLFQGLDSFPLMAIPYFILAGDLMNQGGITSRVVRFADVLVGHFRGGLANVNVVSNVIISGVSGSGTADAVAIGQVMIPSMVRQGYSREFAAGLTAAASCIGPIIPPSIAMVLYGAITGISVGALFLGGIIPGLIIGASLLVVCQYYARKENWPRSPRPTFRSAALAVKESIWALLGPGIILGGIMSGVTTATEAGVVAVVYALVVGLFVYRELKWRDLPRIFWESAVSTAVPVITIAGANIFGWVLARERFSYIVTDAFLSVSTTRWVVILLVIAMLFVVGLFIEGAPMITIFVPVLFPIGAQLGMDPIHWALLIIISVAIGSITPPVGLQLYVTARIARAPISKVVIWPFIWIMTAVVIMMAFIPSTVTFFPRLFQVGQ